MVKPIAPWRRNLVKWLIGGFAFLVALGFLLETGEFLITRKLIRDTLLSWGVGEMIDDARVTVDSCTTVGHTVSPRRGASYVVYDMDCEVTIYVPASGRPRAVDRSQVRLREREHIGQVLGAGRLMGTLGTRWSGEALWGMWLKVPNAFTLAMTASIGLVILVAWRWRRWWWHDRFRRRKRF
jgi:hypothetical protein